MKIAFPKLNFSYILFLVAVLFMTQSCGKGEPDGKACIAIFMPELFKFKVVDKNTQEDLFFSNTPRYNTDQINFSIPDITWGIKPKVETSATSGKYFSIPLSNGTKTGTVKVFIADQLEYTIEYVMKYSDGPCPQYVFDTLKINGTQTETNINGRIILLKK